MPLPKSIIKRAVVVALIFSGVIGGLQVYASWLSVQPNGFDSLLKDVRDFFAFGFILLVLTIALNVLIDVFKLVFRIGQGAGQRIVALLVFCAIVLVVEIIVGVVSLEIRDNAFKNIAARGKPLIAAIKQYQLKHGSPPDALTNLVPDYLPSIPGTGVAAYPNYQFITNGFPDRYGGNPWVLAVDVLTDKLTHDAIFYYPNTNYPSRKEVIILHRIGSWAYISVTKASESK